jgi:hypothetical protein
MAMHRYAVPLIKCDVDVCRGRVQQHAGHAACLPSFKFQSSDDERTLLLEVLQDLA